MKIQVHPNRRFLQYEDGSPFFYLADTAWELFHRLDREETETYLADRAARGFTVVQAVALAELDGLRLPCAANGEVPLHDMDPAKPNPKYFEHVDWVLDRITEHGLVCGFLPTWGDKWNQRHGIGPEVFTPENARLYGEWIGNRYRDRENIIWILGGDRAVENDQHRDIIRAMAEGLTAGDGGAHLKTYHPIGPTGSSDYFPDEDWLDFHQVQSGHKAKYRPNHARVRADYERRPVKPCMDGEPCYEAIPRMDDDFAPIPGEFFDALDVRRRLYWALFAGAHGHTYGAGPIWQMWDHQHEAKFLPPMTWREALQLPGADQLRHARELLLSLPGYFQRIPDQQLILSDPGSDNADILATRHALGDWAILYMPPGAQVTLDSGRLHGENMQARWIDPRNGESSSPEPMPAGPTPQFTAPADAEDWLLLLK